MSWRDDIEADVVQPLMSLPSDGFGIWTSRVIIRSKQYPSSPDGADAGLGTPTVTDLEILPRPKVEDLGNQVLRVSLIVPQNAGGGFTPAQLKPADADGFIYAYIVIGPDGIERQYMPTDLDTRGVVFYSVTLAPLDRAIPF